MGTPGGKLTYHLRAKKSKPVICGDCKMPLQSIKQCRPFQMKNTPKKDRTVSRAYGGSRCHKCVRSRIMRAFLIEEQKCVKQVIAEKEKAQKAETAPPKKKKKSKKN